MRQYLRVTRIAGTGTKRPKGRFTMRWDGFLVLLVFVYKMWYYTVAFDLVLGRNGG